MRFLILGMLLFSKFSLSVELNQYCKYLDGNQDCAQEFLQALIDISEKGGSLILNEGEVFQISDISTEGLNLSKISIVGSSPNGVQPMIKTDRLYLLDINYLSISNIHFKGINFEEGDTEQGNAIIVVGSRNENLKATNFKFIDNFIEDGAEDLLSVWNTEEIEVTRNTFKRSGLAMRIAPILSPGDLRPRGSGLLFLNVENVLVRANEFYSMKKVGIYLDGKAIGSRNVDIIDNYLDIESFEKPTYRYGLLGGAGIYLTNTPNIHNVNIFGNRILNYKGNGMRLNGSGINVKNNFLNYEGLCNDQNNTINGKYVGTAFKSHFLTNSTIENNCIKNSNAGISLESWGDMSNIIISKNIIHQATNALYATNVGNGYYRDIKISRNQFYGTKNYGIALRGTITSFNNQINSNTLSSMSSMEGPLISLQRQENLYFDNNWIQGEARSINWNYLWINRVSNSIFKRSVIKSHSGKDKSFAGIYITSIDSKNNKFDNITFKNLNPAVLDLGVNNTFTNINYK